MIEKLKSQLSGGKLVLTPENITEVALLEDLVQVFKLHRGKELYDAIQKILNNE